MRLFPAGKLVLFRCPVDDRGLVAPFINHPRYSRMSSAVTECEHRVQVLPTGYRPVRKLPVDQQLPAQETWCFLKCSLDLPRVPIQAWKKSNGSNLETGDGNYRHSSLPQEKSYGRTLLIKGSALIRYWLSGGFCPTDGSGLVIAYFVPFG
jgi:hypothetical protein